jgi:hypothetical protein
MPVYPGVYGSPIQKVATWRGIPLVSGYSTARMQANLALATSGYPTSNPVVSGYQSVNITYANDGLVSATVQLVQTDNLASGPRVQLGNPVTLVAGGMAYSTVIPQAHWVEMSCVGGGPTEIRAQMCSQMDWTLEGFSKVEVLYPQYLIAGNYPPAFGSLSNITSPQIVAGS